MMLIKQSIILEKRSNLTTNKTSLILPPISVGNMISTFDLNEHLNNSKS